MNYEVIMFVVAFLCSGALVTVYILWLAGLFSNRAKPQSVYDAIIMDATILKKVEEWLEEEIEDTNEYEKQNGNSDIIYGRGECAESLLSQIAKWRTEVDIRMIK